MSSLGFDSLPSQAASRHKVHGLAFNLMVVGSPGIGKTTLINSLFDFDYGDTPDIDREKTSVHLKVREFRPKNNVLEMKITVIETKGFDNNNCEPILGHINAKYDDFLKDELKVQETRYNDIADSRVHCCIYIISPTGLKNIDIVTMKKLHRKVCLITVIGKSDILTKHERLALKEKIKSELALNDIEVYPAEDTTLPIAVAASNEVIKEGNKRHRVRTYPWGRMYVERDSEFSLLRELVLNKMLTLIEFTNTEHYESYREEVIQSFKNQCERANLLKGNESVEKERSRLKPPTPIKPTTPSRFMPRLN